MSYISEEKKYVVTYKELIFMILVFVAVLVALYPKDLLKQQIVSEKANYDLNMLYLKNLLKHNPEDESLMLILATQSLKTGNKDLAIRLLELLFKSKKKKIRQKALLLSYDLEKERYFYLHNKKKKMLQRRKLRALFYRIYLGKIYNPENVQRWYEEAVFVGAGRETYDLAKQHVAKDPANIQRVKEAFYLSVKYKQKKDSFYYLELLKRYDKKQQQKWLLQQYYLYMNYHEYAQVEPFLKAHLHENPEFEKLLAEFYLFRKHYRAASQLFLKLYAKTKEHKQQVYYFKKALESLVAGNYMRKVVRLAKANEDKFLYDKEMRTFLLKIYLASSNLDAAAKLSKKILRVKYNK